MEDKRTFEEEIKVTGQQLVETVKKLVREGNVRHLMIKNEEGKTLLEIPVTVAAVGAILADPTRSQTHYSLSPTSLRQLAPGMRLVAAARYAMTVSCSRQSPGSNGERPFARRTCSSGSAGDGPTPQGHSLESGGPGNRRSQLLVASEPAG